MTYYLLYLLYVFVFLNLKQKKLYLILKRSFLENNFNDKWNKNNLNYI